MMWRFGLAAFVLAGTVFGAGAQEIEPHVFNLILEGGRAAPTPPVMRTRQGQRVHIGFHSDRVLEIHLHGYDTTFRVGPGASHEMRFNVDVPGTFSVNVHEPDGRHRPIAELVVFPSP